MPGRLPDIVNVKASFGTETVMLPPMHKENSIRKARYLLTVLGVRIPQNPR